MNRRNPLGSLPPSQGLVEPRRPKTQPSRRKTTNPIRLVAASLAVFGLAGCGGLLSPPADPMPAGYDLGATTPSAPAVSMQLRVSGPPWMGSTEMHYRLARSPLQLQAFADSRWVASPIDLVRLRWQRAAAGTPRRARSVEVDLRLVRFEQEFDPSMDSKGVVEVIATANDGAAVRQRVFVSEVAATTADARGGAEALVAASDQLWLNLGAWLEQDR